MKEQSENHTKEKGASVMPSMDLLEYEKVTYVKEMEEYLQTLKSMGEKQAKKRSYESLLRSEIITENGEFSERYRATKLSIQKRI